MAVSQRDVRTRIKAVQNIEKITRAMAMIAAARLRRAVARIEVLRPYANAIRRMTREAAQAAGSLKRVPILQEHAEERTVGLLLVAGDRGLAGAFNSNVVRAGIAAGREHEAAGRRVIYFASGRRVASSLAFRSVEVAESFSGYSDRPGFADARRIAERLVSAFLDGEVDRVEIVYNGYVSAISQVVRRETLLPLQQASLLEEEESPEESAAAATARTPRRAGVRAGPGVGASETRSRLHRDLHLPRVARVDRVGARRPDDGDAQCLGQRGRFDLRPDAANEPSAPGRDHAGSHGGRCRGRGPRLDP